jgi:tetratricopeptide (TPR) repeat protein
VDVDDAAVLSVAVDTESSGILEEIDPAEWAVAGDDEEAPDGDASDGATASASATPDATTADATEWPASAKAKASANGVHPVNGAHGGHGGDRAPAPPPPPRPLLSARTGTPPPVPMGGAGVGWGTGASAHPAVAPGPRLDPAAGKPKPAAQPAPRFETPWQELAQAYEALPAADPKTRMRYLLKESEVWERGEKNTDRALTVLDRAFRLNASDVVVRATLERIASEHDRWDQVCRIYLGGIDGFAPAEHAVSIHLDVARFREALGQIDEAEERYQAVLNLQPDQPHAIERMEEITRSQERWAELAAVLERRVSGPAPIPAGAERRAKMTELAGLYERALEKPYEAIDTLERLVGEAAESDVAESGESRPTGPLVGLEPGSGAAAEPAAAAAAAPGAAATAEAQAGSSDPRGPLDSSGSGNPTRASSDAAARAETIAACEALGRLYGRVGLWVKVVDTLQREAELTGDPVAARAVRIRIADVYERELGQADRAIEAFEAIRALDGRDAEALAALDRLYEAHSRWDDLQETLARRAELAADETERLDLIRRRARILEERIGNPEAAAGALRALGPVALADRELGAALVRNLRRAGLSHEAARTLGHQVEAGRTSGAASSAIVPLLLELSAVRADDLSDRAGARQAIAVALEISPEDPNALAALAELALKENDFVTYAATRRREARARLTASEAVAALLDAGRAYREQANLPAEARACFEEALAREPTSVDALRALAALHAAAGEWTAARDRLLRQLELVEGAEFRAAVLTDLARSVWEGSGDVAEAQRYVDEALELMPDHLPAVLAAADIYYKEGQWAAAERRLTEAIRRLRHQPDHASRLHLRLAEVTERLGRVDESFRQLSESDRLTPGQLSTRLAMGENRFRAGKWREAAALLGPLAEHADAVRQAAAVADGLGHAAEAELKLRRPEKSLALYQAALALEAEHPPSLRALADLALERGEKSAARLLLERLAASPSADREMKVGVLEQLGDLYLEAGESVRARTAYESAVALFEEPKDLLVSVLEKALQLQREADDFEAATHSASLLIDLVQDPKERALRRREAAMLIAARGEGEEALRLLEAACADNPEDDTVLSSLCDLLTRQGKQKQVVKRLATVLPGLPAPEDTREARGLRANLWERLGEGRRKRSVAEAVAAFERAVELDPERMSARIALAALYGPRIEYADAALVNLRRLAEADPARLPSVRALGEAFAKRGMIDPARCAFELLEVLGGMEEGPRRFLKTHPTPAMKPDDPYAGVLDDGDRRVLAGREAAILSEVFSLLWEGAPHPSGPRLEDFGVAAEDKLSPMSDLDVAKVYGQVAKMLGNKRTALYLKRQDVEQRTAELLVQTPPALVFGGLLEQVPLPEARFEIARGLELSRPEYILAAAIRPKQFTELFGTVLRAFHPRHAKRRSNTLDAAAEAASNLRKNVPYKISKRLAEIFQEVGSTSWSSVKWRKVVAETANRTGLLAAGDLRAALPAFLRANQLALPMAAPPPPPAPPPGDAGAAAGGDAGTGASAGGAGTWSPDPDAGTVIGGAEVVALAATSEALRDWLRFALSDEYFRLREKLGTAAVQAAAA